MGLSFRLKNYLLGTLMGSLNSQLCSFFTSGVYKTASTYFACCSGIFKRREILGDVFRNGVLGGAGLEEAYFIE